MHSYSKFDVAELSAVRDVAKVTSFYLTPNCCTIFARSDTAAIILFNLLQTEATIREWHPTIQERILFHRATQRGGY